MSSFCEDLENLLSHHPDSANQEVSQQDDQYGLENLSLTEVQSFNPFREDPIRLISSHNNESSSSETDDDASSSIKVQMFECLCGGLCTESQPGFMVEDEERKCCKASSWSSMDISELSCITQHQLLDKLLDKEILEIMLRTVWEVTRGNAEINPKNLRFSAYRSLFHWLYKKKNPKHLKKYREVIPTCLVKLVRAKFPEVETDLYTGFKQVLNPKRKRTVDSSSDEED